MMGLLFCMVLLSDVCDCCRLFLLMLGCSFCLMDSPVDTTYLVSMFGYRTKNAWIEDDQTNAVILVNYIKLRPTPPTSPKITQFENNYP